MKEETELLKKEATYDYMSDKSRLVAAYNWSMMLDCARLIIDGREETYNKYAVLLLEAAFRKDDSPIEKDKTN